MTLQERFRLATAARQQRCYARAEELRRLLDEGEPLKRAAYRVGWSYRSAKRWKSRVR